LIDGLVCEGLTKEYTGSNGKEGFLEMSIKIPSEGVFSLIGMTTAGVDGSGHH
jgi:hypothetical protein